MSEPLIFDHDYLKTYTSEDEDLQREVLGLFFGQIESLLQRLDPAASPEDWKAAAHAIKGSSRGLGLNSIGDLCQELEEGSEASETAKAGRKSELVEGVGLAKAAVQSCYPGIELA